MYLRIPIPSRIDMAVCKSSALKVAIRVVRHKYRGENRDTLAIVAMD